MKVTKENVNEFNGDSNGMIIAFNYLGNPRFYVTQSKEKWYTFNTLSNSNNNNSFLNLSDILDMYPDYSFVFAPFI